ncbi:MAG: c-type cytochrome [Ramlibacter sp.]
MRFAAPFVLAAFTAIAATPASAQFAKAEDAVKYRQSALFVMAQHFGRIGAMANGKVPYDAKVALENAQVVDEMARLPWAGFVPGTEKVGNTRAKPEIWTEQVKFREHNEKLLAETPRLVAAAKTNNLDNLKSAFQSTAATCKSCHDSFRNQ